VGDIGEGLDIVDQRRIAVYTRLRRKRGFTARKRELSLHRFDGGGLFTADVMTGTWYDPVVDRPVYFCGGGKIETRVLPILQRGFHCREGFFLVRVDVKDDTGDTRRQGSDGSPFDHLERGLLQQDAILEGARFIFIAIAYQVFFRGLFLCRDEFPFLVGGETAAAQPAQTGLPDLRDQSRQILQSDL